MKWLVQGHTAGQGRARTLTQDVELSDEPPAPLYHNCDITFPPASRA